MATKDFSCKQESMIASFLGWEVVSGSGAAACFPGDVISDEWLGECKTHVDSGHKIFFSKDVWEKIKTEASVKHRFPVLFTDDGTQKDKNTWCLCLCDRLVMEDVWLEPLTKGINKNISFDHDTMVTKVKEVVTHKPGMFPVFIANWNDEKVGICQLSAFRDIVRE